MIIIRARPKRLSKPSIEYRYPWPDWMFMWKKFSLVQMAHRPLNRYSLYPTLPTPLTHAATLMLATGAFSLETLATSRPASFAGQTVWSKYVNEVAIHMYRQNWVAILKRVLLLALCFAMIWFYRTRIFSQIIYVSCFCWVFAVSIFSDAHLYSCTIANSCRRAAHFGWRCRVVGSHVWYRCHGGAWECQEGE